MKVEALLETLGKKGLGKEGTFNPLVLGTAGHCRASEDIGRVEGAWSGR